MNNVSKQFPSNGARKGDVICVITTSSYHDAKMVRHTYKSARLARAVKCDSNGIVFKYQLIGSTIVEDVRYMRDEVMTIETKQSAARKLVDGWTPEQVEANRAGFDDVAPIREAILSTEK